MLMVEMEPDSQRDRFSEPQQLVSGPAAAIGLRLHEEATHADDAHASAPARPATLDNASQSAFNSDYPTARRIMKGIVDWMKRHQTEIAGLDPNRPVLPQLDRLTDDQLRAIMRGMDPMSK